MPDYDFHFNSSRVGSLRIDGHPVRGSGGAASPALSLDLRGTLYTLSGRAKAPDGTSRMVTPVTLVRISGQLDAGTALALGDAVPTDVAAETQNFPRPRGFAADVRVALNATQIHELESIRRGGSMSLRYRLRLLIALHQECPEARESGNPMGGIEGVLDAAVVRHYIVEVQVPIVIPTSVWAETILPTLGFGKRHVMEIEVPAPPLDVRLERAKAHLDAAWTAYAAGDDRGAMTKCLLFWEALLVEFVGPGTTMQIDSFKLLFDNAGLPKAKSDKLKVLLYHLAALNHMARHDRDSDPTPLDHRDAEFAVVSTHMALGYLSKLGALATAR